MSAPRPPRASVVIPVWNNLRLTVDCLDSLARTTETTSFEIVVVDNGSSDGVESELARRHGAGQIRLIRNESNRGFAIATNQGIAASEGSDFVLLLNNDTIALPGWLDGLVQELDAHPGTGIAGSLLLYPGGAQIQHAGLRIAKEGGEVRAFHAFQFRILGRTPEALAASGVDGVTGASLLVRRSVLDSVGVLDEAFINGFEDIDFCLRARAAGWDIRYAPASRLLHLESRTPGRKASERINQRRFQELWRGRLPPSLHADRFELDLRELRLRRRLEIEPGRLADLLALRSLVRGRRDGEDAELLVRARASADRRLGSRLRLLLHAALERTVQATGRP